MGLKPGYKQTDVGVFPKDWEIKPLGDIGQIATGNTPPTRDPTNYGDEYLFVSPGDLGFAKHISRTEKMLSKRGFSISRPFPAGSVLFVCIGSTIGKCGLASELLTSNQQINAILPSAAMSSDYLYYAVSAVAANIKSLAGEQAVPIVNKTQFSETTIPLPPTKAEQEAIAGALSDADALIGALGRLIAKKRDLKQAAMQQLLTGQTRLPGFHGEWEVKRVEDVAVIDPENLGSDTSPDYFFNYISLEDVDTGTLRGYTEQVFRTAPSRARRKLRKGDVLVSTVRPNLKSHLLIRNDISDTVCSTGFSVARCKPALADPAFVFFHLFADVIERQIESLLTGSNYPAINSRDVKALRMPCPSLPEQTAIATVLSDMDAELAALEQKRDKTRALKQGMMQELLTGRVRLV